MTTVMRILLFIFAVGVGFAICSMLLCPFAIHILHDKVIFDVNSLTSVDEKYLLTLLHEGKIHTANFAMEQIVQFYQTLLTTMVGLGTLGGFLGFLYIRNSHTRDIREGLQYEIKSEDSRKVLRKELDELIKKEKAEGELGVQLEKITDLEQRIISLENLQEEFVLERPQEDDVLTPSV